MRLPDIHDPLTDAARATIHNYVDAIGASQAQFLEIAKGLGREDLVQRIWATLERQRLITTGIDAADTGYDAMILVWDWSLNDVAASARETLNAWLPGYIRKSVD